MRLLLYKICFSLFILFTSLTFFVKCSDDNVTNSGNDTAIIQIVSGNNQTGTAGEALAEAVVIQVVNSAGEGIGNLEVEIEIIEGEGELSNTSSFITNSNGLVEVEWIIGPDYNALQIQLNDVFDPVYVYAETENPTGLNETRTLNSITKITDALYEITFYGDHTGIAERMNQLYVNYYSGASADLINPGFNCSVFTTHGDMGNILYGRSFDNPQSLGRCITLMCRYNSPGCYASLVPTRTRELGGDLYDPPNDLTEIPLTQRNGLLDAPFFSPDGINETGLVVALADISSRSYTPDPAKGYLYKTMLIREILDHAATVDEAADIALSHNLFDYGLNNFSTHALVADATGRSIIIELADRQIRIIENTEDFHAATNSPLFGKSISEARGQCERYRYIYDRLSYLDGDMSLTQGMNILQTVGYEFTQWSIVYDITNKALDLALDYDFTQYYHFEFQSIQN